MKQTNSESFWPGWCYKYTHLNLATFRRNGVAVATPLWFVAVGERLYIRTMARSGKVKRLRNNPEVEIAPCDDKGKQEGATVKKIYGRVLDSDADAAECAIAEEALQNRYGAQRTAMTQLMQQQNEPLVYLVLAATPQ